LVAGFAFMADVRALFLGVILAMPLLLAGCGGLPPLVDPPDPEAGPAEIVSGCCEGGLEPLPDWALDVLEANAGIVRPFALIRFRPGRLTGSPEAMALFTGALQPFDLVLINSNNRATGLMFAGHFSHSATYLGTEEQLRASGLWDHPALAPHRAAISAGSTFLEAHDGGVQLKRPEIVLDGDAALILRPQGMDHRRLLARSMPLIGTPFDTAFDASDPSRLFCAELIDAIYPHARVPTVEVYGRQTILIDAVAAAALSGRMPFSFVGYVEGGPRVGVRALSERDFARRLRTAWD
jgi:hypothetical protein